MPVNTKTNPVKNPLSAPFDTALKYIPTASGWGLEALFEGYHLVFSGEFTPKRLHAEVWLSVLKFFYPSYNKTSGKNSSGVISNVDLYDLFSDSAKQAWNKAYEFAKLRGGEVEVEDIFLALLREPSVKNLFTRIKVDAKQAEKFINNYLKLTTPLNGQAVKQTPFEAFALAAKLHNHKIGSLMLLGGLLRASPKDNLLQAIFSNIGLGFVKLELFSVWLLDLDYNFPPGATSDKFLFCLRQASGLEEHFGYFFELPAIEAAVDLSQGQTLKDLQHLKALQLMVKAGLLAQSKKTKIISEDLIKQAAKK
jgi:hypothetical protein